MKNILTNSARAMALRLAQGKTMQQITGEIMRKCRIDENGKLWSPSGKCIGWYNRETCIGWCNLKGYRELKGYEPQNTAFDGEYEYDDADLTQYDEVDLAEFYDVETEDE